MTINDPRFNSIHNDPRFIKPTKKKQKQEQEQDNRFTHIKDSSKKKTKKDILPTLIDYARGRVILESSDDEDEEEEEEEEEQEEESDDEDVELGPTGPKRAQEIDLNEDEEEEEETPQHINPTHRIAIVNLDWDNLKPLDIYKVFSSLLVPPHQTPLTTTADSKPTTEHKTVQGAVKRVCFYKSEFGKRRMAEEDVQGPPREIFNTTNKKLVGNDDDDDDEEEEDLDNEDRGAEFDELALRKYQLDRLRYFYAIVELNSAQSAQHVFSEIDGTEFERTANIFDLSYVPDDMAFDEADLWDECTQDSNDYKGVDFSTDVLRHSKVKLTWDSEDPVRRKYTRLNTQKLTQEELDELDFKAFIASGSSGRESGGSEEEEEEGSGRRQDGGRLRTLLGLTEDAGGQAAMEGQEELDITFKPGFVDLPSPAPAPVEEPVPRPKKSRNQRTKDKLKDKQEAEPGATRRDKQAQLELLMMDDAISSQNPRHFDLAQILKHEKLATGTKKNKKNKKKNKSLDPSRESDSHQKHEEDLVDQFALDQDDSRFAPALVHDPEFAIDPSNPHFKKTKNMLGLLSSTRAKRAPTHSPNTPTTGAPKTHSSHPPSSLLPTSTAQLLRNLKHSRTDTRAKRVRIE